MCATSEPMHHGGPSLAAPFILLVDDSTSCLDLLGEILTGAGYPCVGVGSGEEALETSATDRPLAVVTDYSMPGLDGGELADALNVRHPGLPIILVTGEPLDAPSIAASRGRFLAVLSKPVAPADLIRLLHEVGLP